MKRRRRRLLETCTRYELENIVLRFPWVLIVANGRGKESGTGRGVSTSCGGKEGSLRRPRGRGFWRESLFPKGRIGRGAERGEIRGMVCDFVYACVT